MINQVNITPLYSSGGILAVNKPAGFETFAGAGVEKCLTKILRITYGDDLSPVHRLDRDTTGVQLFALNAAMVKKLTELFKHRKTVKFYLAVCFGYPQNREGMIRRNLSEWRGGHHPVSVVKGGGGLEAETAYQTLAINREFPASLILFIPHQGRTHQIRVHAQALSRPILGDDQYGDRPANKKIKELSNLNRQALHAWRLLLPEINPDGTEIEICAPIPSDLSPTLDALFPDWREALGVIHDL